MAGPPVNREATRVNRILGMLSQGIPASEVARSVAVSRQDVYALAAKGVEKGVLERVPGRPARWRPGPTAPDTSPKTDGRDRVLHAWTTGPSEFGDWPPS